MRKTWKNIKQFAAGYPCGTAWSEIQADIDSLPELPKICECVYVLMHHGKYFAQELHEVNIHEDVYDHDYSLAWNGWRLKVKCRGHEGYLSMGESGRFSHHDTLFQVFRTREEAEAEDAAIAAAYAQRVSRGVTSE